MNHSEKFAHFIWNKHSSLQSLPIKEFSKLVAPQLVTDVVVPISENQFNTMSAACQVVDRMMMSPSYRGFYENQMPQLRDRAHQAPTAGACLSLDFHIDQNGTPKLIEANTNAAFLALGVDLYRYFEQPLVQNKQSADVAEMFAFEILKSDHVQDKSNEQFIYIVDETPANQRLYVEFLVIQSLLQAQGFECLILDSSELAGKEPPALVYNRTTDFGFATQNSQTLRKWFHENSCVITPNPYHYEMLANKQRLIDWLEPSFQETFAISENDRAVLQQILLKSWKLNPETAPEIWSRRKSLFFKPTESFGSKLAFRGGSVSQAAFAKVIEAGGIAQEYCPPSMIETPNGSFKYDLRCFFYDGMVQLIVARLYQGQVTNLQTMGGGFACVKLI
jgi:hypothetical protein